MRYLPFVLTPAYGRDYKSTAEVAADLYAGKDFLCEPVGRYVTVREIAEVFGSDWSVNVRYAKLRKVAPLVCRNGALRLGNREVAA